MRLLLDFCLELEMSAKTILSSVGCWTRVLSTARLYRSIHSRVEVVDKRFILLNVLIY